MLIVASARNGSSAYGAGPPTGVTFSPLPLLMLERFIDNVNVSASICDASEPPVTKANDVVKSAPVAGGPIGPVNVLLASCPESKSAWPGAYHKVQTCRR